MREAVNRDIFLDRIQLQTGLKVRIMEGVEANMMNYMAVLYALNRSMPTFSRSNSIVMEVGGGRTEVMLLQRGAMISSINVPVGSVRMEEQLGEQVTGVEISAFAKQLLRSPLNVLDSQLKLKKVSKFVAVGKEISLAAWLVGDHISDYYHTITRDDFIKLVKELESRDEAAIVKKYSLSYAELETFFYAMAVYYFVFIRSAAQEVIVPVTNLNKGVLLNRVQRDSKRGRKNYEKQVVASSLSLGAKYQIDVNHSQEVHKICLNIFHALKNEFSLTNDQKLYLRVAALLHDIGKFINTSAHHKHGQYIINNSEIYGLTAAQLRIVGNIIRYHRKSAPKSSHSGFVNLPRKDRLTVLKCAAVLQLADALDSRHERLLTGSEFEVSGSEFLIHLKTGDCSLEKLSVKNRCDLFSEVFGLKVRFI